MEARRTLCCIEVGLPDFDSSNADLAAGTLAIDFVLHDDAGPVARRRLGGEARGGEAQGCVDQRPKRVAAKGTGSQNGICPVISSARSRPVAGPSVKP